ncbi:cupin domain-containing protein [Streptomyces sp. NPDC058683]|uniref:cupin domain-containing protein n=1 Tax=Streptomyces sp. NPDC058683 TaxID=3346597 RepID=UPI00365CB1FC
MTDTAVDKTDVPEVRLVVTGHDADNRGIIARDTRVGPTPGLAADSWEARELWSVKSLPSLPDDGLAAIESHASGPGSVRLIQCVIHPEGAPLPPGDPDVTSRTVLRTDDTAMHFTASVDLVVVLDGEVEVVLDGARTVLRQGDFLVQNGTRHEWHNYGDRPARLGVVFLATEHRGY